MKSYLVTLTVDEFEKINKAIPILEQVFNDNTNTISVWNYSYGICYNLGILIDVEFYLTISKEQYITKIINCWNEHSDNFYYPIKSYIELQSSGYTEILTAMDCFNYAFDHGLLYDRNTEYGKARYRLLGHIIKCLKELVEYNEG